MLVVLTNLARPDFFVKKHVRRGLLPEILSELLEVLLFILLRSCPRGLSRETAQARKLAKKQMAEAKDPFVQAVLNGRQLAIKVRPFVHPCRQRLPVVFFDWLCVLD